MAYFNALSSNIGEFPIYLSEQLLAVAKRLRQDFTKTGISSIFYTGSFISPSAVKDRELQIQLYQLTNRAAFHVLSLGCTALREMVPIERALVSLPAGESSDVYFKRYIDRVGEKVIIPLLGEVTLKRGSEANVLKPGMSYRVNSRTAASASSAGAVVLVLNFLDIDLDEHLTPVDKLAEFPLTKEEGGDAKSSERALY